jgi:hypothetical protein
LIVNGYQGIENRSWKLSATRIGQRFYQALGIQRHPKSIDDCV